MRIHEMTSCWELPTTEPPPRWCSNAMISYGEGGRSHIEPERVNVPQSHLVCGGDTSWREAGRWVHARKWQKGENECIRAEREVRWVTGDGLWTWAAMMLWSPVGSRASSHTEHVQSAQISSSPFYLSPMEMMCEFISSHICNHAKPKWCSSFAAKLFLF